MIVSRNNRVVNELHSYYVGKKVIIGIDSSKSNSAVVIGNERGEILDDYEFNGAGSDIDVYELCFDIRKALKVILKDAEVVAVGLENIITKKEDGYKGLDIHMSRAKITAVFDNFIFYFQEYHNIMPRLINNQEWKSAVLPDEYCKRTHKKGSKDYFDSIGGRWAGRKDDVTDAVCIFKYLVTGVKVDLDYTLDTPMKSSHNFTVGIFYTDLVLDNTVKRFKYNEKFTVDQLVNTMSAKLEKRDKYGAMRIPVDALSIFDIYSMNLLSKFPRQVDEVVIVVSNES